MGDSPLIYKEQVRTLLNDSRVHPSRVDHAIAFLEQRFRSALLGYTQYPGKDTNPICGQLV